ncbi:heterokaryon incompatibility, partial [Leptodontidium sp. 2 PMI_412]
ASNHTYVTLSYLWGEGGNEMPFSGRLPLKTPRTIEDALLVTLRLGFQYLWIDRYCINQDNVGETYAQLRLMGSIYRNSELTLIAAAGDDPSYGLPGVGKRHRTPLASAQIGHHFLRQARDISHVVWESRWHSRGWTYQEGILATRRLVFTDEQVYFEC